MRVLIVDRDHATRAALRLFLEIAIGADLAAEAASAQEAVAAIALLRPDVIIVEWEMPGGSMLLRSAAADGAAPTVIALSSRPEARQSAFIAGADAFVSKCDPPEQVAQALSPDRVPASIHRTSLAAETETS